MKNSTTLLLLLFFSALFSSCLKDKCHRTYTLYKPVYRTVAEVRANMKSNPAKPLERPGKLFIRGNYIFLNEVDRGIHVIDNSNPAAPKQVSFIDIPGNIDIAVKDNTLYADNYDDMVTMDITDPLHVIAKKFTENVFPFRKYTGFVPDSNLIIVDWIRKDTTVATDCGGGNPVWYGCANCEYFLSASSSGEKASSPFGAGVGGSMARFALMNDYLYTVTDDKLNVFNISSSLDPQLKSKVNIGWNIETIYPFKDKLFIGSTTGMFVYQTTDPSNPTKLTQFSHIRSCDPVIADDYYAYVTLRTSTFCAGNINELQVLNISNITYPTLIKAYTMTEPHGLSKDGNLLFVCNGDDGLKIYYAADPSKIQLRKQIKNISTYDVIAFNHIAIVVTKDGLYQFDYSNVDNIYLKSKISFNKLF